VVNRKIFTVGCPFAHDLSSCNSCSGSAPKRINWSHKFLPEDIEEGDSVVYFDMNHRAGLDIPLDSGINTFLWLCESREVTPKAHKDVYTNSDLFLSRYKGVFTCDDNLLRLDDRFFKIPNGSNLPWIRDTGVHPKSKLISMVCSGKSSCEGHRVRNKVADSLIGKIDLFGRFINPIASKEEGLNDYMFSIAMENARYKTYYTEKLLDCFATGTIPIYWGSPDIGEHFNMDGIIILDDNFEEVISNLSPEYYNDRMDAIKDNYQRCMDIEMADDLVCDKILEILS